MNFMLIADSMKKMYKKGLERIAQYWKVQCTMIIKTLMQKFPFHFFSCTKKMCNYWQMQVGNITNGIKIETTNSFSF